MGRMGLNSSCSRRFISSYFDIIQGLFSIVFPRHGGQGTLKNQMKCSKILSTKLTLTFFAKNHKYYVKIKIGKKKSGNFVYSTRHFDGFFFKLKN